MVKGIKNHLRKMHPFHWLINFFLSSIYRILSNAMIVGVSNFPCISSPLAHYRKTVKNDAVTNSWLTPYVI